MVRSRSLLLFLLSLLFGLGVPSMALATAVQPSITYCEAPGFPSACTPYQGPDTSGTASVSVSDGATSILFDGSAVGGLLDQSEASLSSDALGSASIGLRIDHAFRYELIGSASVLSSGRWAVFLAELPAFSIEFAVNSNFGVQTAEETLLWQESGGQASFVLTGTGDAGDYLLNAASWVPGGGCCVGDMSSLHFSFAIEPIPEPGSLLLFGVGMLLVGRVVRRQ